MESIGQFSKNQFPSSTKDTLDRREEFLLYLTSILPIGLPVNYTFKKVIGDGSCFFHAILRYYGYLRWHDLPNKDTNELDEQETIIYLETLSNLRETSTEYIRNFIGDPEFVLDSNVPEYQLICKYISDTSNVRIIILEYDGYKEDKSLNKVCQFEPDSSVYTDTIIMINFSHHFTLIFPTSTDPRFDTKIIRNVVGDDLIIKAISVRKLF